MKTVKSFNTSPINNVQKNTKIVLFNKPYGVHSQFRKDNDAMKTLADFFADKSLRVVGRLDKDSEGLLLLTNNGKLANAIASPNANKPKTYWVQVENTPTDDKLQMLRQGVMLKDGKTLPAEVTVLKELPIELWERNPPIRERKTVPTAWLSITIFEGKNRQIRRMTASVGLPCLRLVRVGVAHFSLDKIAVGQSVVKKMTASELALFGI